MHWGPERPWVGVVYVRTVLYQGPNTIHPRTVIHFLNIRGIVKKATHYYGGDPEFVCPTDVLLEEFFYATPLVPRNNGLVLLYDILDEFRVLLHCCTVKNIPAI